MNTFNNNYQFPLNPKTSFIIGILNCCSIFLAFKLLGDFKYAVGFVGNLPINFIEYLLLVISLLTFVLTLLIYFFRIRRISKKENIKKKNIISVNNLTSFILLQLIGIIGGLLLYRNGNVNLIIPFFLFLYGFSYLKIIPPVFNRANFIGFFTILISLISLFTSNYNLYLLLIGVGLSHVIYALLYFKKSF